MGDCDTSTTLTSHSACVSLGLCVTQPVCHSACVSLGLCVAPLLSCPLEGVCARHHWSPLICSRIRPPPPLPPSHTRGAGGAADPDAGPGGPLRAVRAARRRRRAGSCGAGGAAGAGGGAGRAAGAAAGPGGRLWGAVRPQREREREREREKKKLAAVRGGALRLESGQARHARMRMRSRTRHSCGGQTWARESQGGRWVLLAVRALAHLADNPVLSVGGPPAFPHPSISIAIRGRAARAY